jgi:cytochrome c oxidase cbb3-type subunit 4
MYKEVLSEIKGISIYPLISFIIFFTFFSVITVWVLKSRKNDFDEISKIPLSDEDN